MNSTTTTATAEYLAAVRSELSDLPATELADVLDDVAGHLDEVAHELDGEVTAQRLESRLGTPQQYVDELRTAAGYPPRQPVPSDRSGTTALAWGIVATAALPLAALAWLSLGLGAAFVLLLVAGLLPALLGIRALGGRDPRIVGETALWRTASGWLDRRVSALPPALRRDLVAVGQPAWWLLRGTVAGVAVFWFVVLTNVGWETSLPGLTFAALLGILVSIWVARTSQRDRRWLWVVVPANVLTVLVIAVMTTLGAWWDIGQSRGTTYASTPGGASGLLLDGRLLTNVFPFDAAGKPLSGVRLYDAEGNPVTIGLERCPESNDPAAIPADADNVFPKITVTYNDVGCTEAIGPTFVVPPLAPRTPGASTPVPSAPTPTPVTPTPTR